MVVYFGADHRGFELKGRLVGFVKNLGYEIFDCGSATLDPNDDYPDVAAAVAEKIVADQENARGILICGSGAGVNIAANKFRGVRATIGFLPDQVYANRHDDDVNILALASDFTNPEDAENLVKIFQIAKRRMFINF